MKTITLNLLVSTLFLPLAYAQDSHKPADPHAGHDHAAHTAQKPAVGALSDEKLPKAAKVFFKNLKNGQTIPPAFKVQFGLQGMKIKPAGEFVAGTGHHHLIIDGSGLPRGQVVPADEKHVHFGQGQTEYELKLAPGEHRLTLQFADGAHLSWGPQLSETITVKVSE